MKRSREILQLFISVGALLCLSRKLDKLFKINVLLLPVV